MTTTLSTFESRQWGSACHFSALAGFLLPGLNVLAPLGIWLWKREGSAFVDEQGKAAISFHLSLCLYALAAPWYTQSS